MVLKLSTGKSSKILIHGTSKTWHIPHDAWKIIKENHYEWTAHSHPTMTKIIASPEDRETLKLFTWQEKSIIIDLNIRYLFEYHTFLHHSQTRVKVLCRR